MAKVRVVAMAGDIMNYKQPDMPIAGFMTDEELEWLYNTATQMTSIVEIGSWLGRSTHALLSGCDGHVFAVDTFDGSPGERDGAHKLATVTDCSVLFKANVGHFKNLIVMQMYSLLASKYFANESIDMVFIDGNHSFDSVVMDITQWKPKVKNLLCGHDANEKEIKDALKYCKIPYDVINTGNGIWYAEVHQCAL